MEKEGERWREGDCWVEEVVDDIVGWVDEIVVRKRDGFIDDGEEGRCDVVVVGS